MSKEWKGPLTRENADALADILSEYAAGGELQEEQQPQRWETLRLGLIITNSDWSYRIKPKPLECWVNVYPNTVQTQHESESEARDCACSDALRVAVHMREVE